MATSHSLRWLNSATGCGQASTSPVCPVSRPAWTTNARPRSTTGRLEYGDERDPETRQFLRSISPLAHADQIKKPLLVMHSKNDQRVRIGEADQIVSAVERTGSLVWYVQFDGEGHNLERREHAVYQMEIEILFLKTFLLGH